MGQPNSYIRKRESWCSEQANAGTQGQNEHSWQSQAAKPSETLNIMEPVVQLNSNAKLSEHFSLGEMTKSSSHPEVYNIPSHEAIANLKRVCGWLEVLRKRYNERYNACHLDHQPSVMSSVVETSHEISPRASLGRDDKGGVLGRDDKEKPIIINSGYRSPQLNKKIGGVPASNHLTGCAVDIRVADMEQLIRYANILLDYSKESHQDFDELLIERRSASPLGSSKNRYGAIWLHFAVRPSGNRRKVAFIQA